MEEQEEGGTKGQGQEVDRMPGADQEGGTDGKKG